jgi:class 3 adenylate cyclase/predicted ATPase
VLLLGAEDHRMDLAAWLHGLGLERYVPAFHDNDVDGEVLRRLTAEDLRELGVSSIGHRRRLLDAIAALTEVASEPTTARAVVGTVTPRATPAQANAERRQLTVMFCDLVGSTALSARLDPEDLREIIAAYHRAVAETIAESDGFVSRYMGDGVLAYFGYPQAHEDDAERAVRAGLGLIDAVSRLDVKSAKLQARVGIATGLVVVGDLIGEGSAQEQSVVGETPNLAARLQALAEPDAVVIGAGTRRLIGDLFEYRDLGAVEVRGLAGPVPAWQVLRPSVVASRFEALHGSALTPLVGRDEEIELLLRRWARAKAGDGQVVLISGEPGIGKSRIAAALAERLHAEPYLRLRYFCSPYHQNSALFPFVDQLGRAAGFVREDPPAVKLEKLEALVARAAPPGEDVVFLADLLSLPASGRHPLPGLSPQRKKERTLEALLRQLDGLARQQPVLTVFEDAHWIDPTSRELLDLTIERVRSLPVLLIMTFRPEFQMPWTGQPQVTMLALNRLDRHDRTVLVEQIADGKALPDEVIAQIIDRADGVPLFVEELTKSVLESGLLRAEGDRYVLDGALPPFAIPTTLHDSLMARLDRLASVRMVAQIGAAIGRQFSYGLLRAVSRLPEDELQAALARLVASELVFQRGAPPDAVYSFKHALVQDAAHGSLLRGDRQQLHAQIAEALETHSPELMDSQPEVLAHHYTEAGSNEKAVDYWGRAGKRSAARSAVGEALIQFEKGLARLGLMPESPERRRKELDLQCQLGSVRLAAYGYGAPQTGAAYDRARDLWLQLGYPPGYLRVPWGQWMYHINGGELDVAQRFAEELLHLSQQQKDGSSGEVLGHLCVGVCHNLRGVFVQARLQLTEASRLYDLAEHRTLVVQTGVQPPALTLGHLGLALWCLGYPDQALARSLAGIDGARREEHQPSLSTSLSLAMRALSFLGDDTLLAQLADELAAMGTEQGFPYWRAQARIYQGWITAKGGDLESGLFAIREGLAASRAAGARIWIPRHLALEAQVEALRGHIGAAASILIEAVSKSAERGEHWYEGELHRLRGELLLKIEEPEEAEKEFARALTVARTQQARMWELRAALSLARLRRDRGRHTEARDLLAPVYGWFTEGFDTPDLKEAKALLGELA